MNSTNNLSDISGLYDNLKTLTETAFPKTCATCGQVFNSPEDFVKDSESIAGCTGLKSTLDEDDKPIIELFRNCICGSTLMDEFRDRRDLSKKGLKRREVFEKILNILADKGVPVEQTRTELLKFMNGAESPFLEKFGITFNR